MFFTIRSNNCINRRSAIIKRQAMRVIVYSNFGSTEQIIDKYLKLNKHTTLKAVCIQVVKNCKILNTDDNEVIITIPNKSLNKLAELISYGNGEFTGSNILRKMFYRR